jgi:replicative DNA helicase
MDRRVGLAMTAQAATTRTQPAQERRSPFDRLAERSVLGAVLLGRDVDELDGLEVDDFLVPGHREILEAMRALRHVRADVVLVADEVRTRGQLRKLDGAEVYLVELADPAVAHVENLPHHIAVIRRHAARRRLLKVAAALSASAYEHADPSSAASEAIAKLQAIAGGAK